MADTYKGDDRRVTKRVEVDFIVTYKVREPLEVRMLIKDEEVYAKMLDLSETGMAILTSYELPTSTVLLIKFTLHNPYASKNYERNRTMDITGEVRYNILSEESKKEECRIGIYFTKIAEEDKCTIANFVKWQSIYKPAP